VILMKRNNEVIKKVQISSGGVSGTAVDPKIIFKNAIENLASGVILAHNHPSGNTNPSEPDKRLTQNLKRAGEVLEIPILDHLIFTDHNYFSFADESMM
ncbi:MAG: JAB domain-containing protein, partial [Marinoscillum sp.]